MSEDAPEGSDTPETVDTPETTDSDTDDTPETDDSDTDDTPETVDSDTDDTPETSDNTDDSQPTTAPGTVDTADTRGRRFVVGLYVALVGVAATAGVLTATFVDGLTRPELFGVIPLPATQAGFAVFGGVTMAVVLGVPLSGIVYVSRRIDDPDAVE